jgi:hypothetical protein
MEGYQTHYAGLHLLVRRQQESFEFTVFDGSSIVWRANASDMEAAKDGAIFEAREWLGHPALPLPAWEPFTDDENLHHRSQGPSNLRKTSDRS